MTISIGTSAAPSAYDTHAAWLRQRADGNRFVADVVSVAGDEALPAGRAPVLEGRDVIARMIPPSVGGALI